MFQLLRRAFYRVRRYPPAQLQHFSRLFGHLEIFNRVGERQISLPEVAEMALIEQAAYLRGDTYRVPEDYAAVLPRAQYCPTNNVVLTSSKEILSESLNTGTLNNLDMRALYTRRVRRVPGYAAVLRSRYNNYYHSVVDNFPRLLALHQSPFADLAEIKLLCPRGLTDAEAYFLPRLCPPNVKVVQVEEGSLYDVEHLIFTPFKTRRFAGYLPPAYVDYIRSNFVPKRASRRGKRILISRERARMRRIENHDELVAKLAEHGFREVVLEELPIEQQIALFFDAEAVVGAHGSGLVNVLFSQDIHVVELFPARYVVPHYFYLSKSVGHRYSYWCGDRNLRDAATFHVDVPAVLKLLCRAGLG
ncbi:MAG TPA: glycosyltransferase family 61 protein [Rhodothermales bacterium]|nr:glycosyltransferase family 61 protein [Rhodothermales bacterium]